MADTYLNFQGKPIKLVDLGDGVYAFASAIEGAEALSEGLKIIDSEGNELDLEEGGIKIVGADGNVLAVLPNGKLPVDLTLTGDTELTANVAIQDGTDSGKKLTVNDDGQALVKAADLEALIGEVDDEPEENTLLARLKSLEDKIDAITAGTTPVVSQLSGSNMELYGPTLAVRPDISTVPIGATYTIVDDTQNFDSFISNGTDWLEV